MTPTSTDCDYRDGDAAAPGDAGADHEMASPVTRSVLNAEVLRVIRREMASTIQPELTSDYAKYVGSLTTQMLDYLADCVDPYPRTEAARTALLEVSARLPPLASRFASELDDPASLDEPLADTIAAAAASRDEATLYALGSAVGAIDDALYTAETTRHAQQTASEAALMARIDPEVTTARYDAYAESVLRMNDPAVSITKIPGGHSKDTFLITLRSGREVVVRKDFPFGPVNSSAADEFGVLCHLANAGLPVPRPIAAEHDPKWLGQKFLLMEKAAGRDAHAIGMADRATGRKIAFELARILARLHSMDPAEAGLDVKTALDPQEAVRRYLASWREWWDRNRIHPSSLGEAAYAWMERHIPRDIARVVIVHGDARPGNMLFHDGKVTALLDWEFVHAGDPAEDLQYAKGFIEPFMDWTDFLQAYRDAGGAPISEAGARYYDVFRSWRNMACTDVSWGGFIRRDYPAFKLAAQGVVYKRYLAQELAKSMKTVSWAEQA